MLNFLSISFWFNIFLLSSMKIVLKRFCCIYNLHTYILTNSWKTIKKVKAIQKTNNQSSYLFFVILRQNAVLNKITDYKCKVRRIDQ